MLEKKILALFSIRKQEKQFVSLSALYAFFDGVIYEYVLVIPLALFLGRSEISTLPYVYILTALAFLVTIFIFNFFEQRVPLFKLTASTVVTLAISSMFFWTILKTTTFTHIPMALLVWSWIVSCFLAMISDYLFSSIITLQQAKRLYGPLGAAKGLGAILGAASIPLLVKVTDTENILLLVPILFGLSLMLQFKIKKIYGKQLNAVQKDRESSDSHEKGQFKILNLFKRKYILFVLIVGVLISFQYYTLEMLFNKQVQTYFQSEENIAKFLGIFYTIINITSLFISAFIFGRFLERYGAIVALSIMPVTSIVIMTFAFIFHLIPATMALVFWMIALIRLVESLMNISVNEQGIVLLFQPLRARERIWALTQHNFSAFAVAIGGIGVILLTLTKVFGVNFLVFGITLIIFCLIQIYFLNRLRIAYVQELMTALNKHFLFQPRFQKIDKESLTVLKKSLQSPFPDEVTYVLKLLEKANFSEFQKALVATLDHPSDILKNFALSKIEQYKLQAAFPKVLDICKQNPSDKSIVALSACGGHKTDNLLETWLTAENLSLQTGAILGLLKHGTKNGRLKAEATLHDFALSQDSAKKQKVAWLLGQLRKSKLPNGTSLVTFLEDENFDVRKTACLATVHIQDPSFYAPLIHNLSIPCLKQEALAGLMAQNPKQFISFLKKNFKNFPESTQEFVIKVLENMRYSDSFLRHLLESSQRKMFHAVLHALSHKHSYLETSKVNRYLDQEIAYLKKLETYADLIGQNPKNALVKSLLHREMELGLQRIFRLLSFIYPKRIISNIEHGFYLHKEDALSYAIELLLRILSTGHAKQLSSTMTDIQHRIMGMDVEHPNPSDEIKGLTILMSSSEDYYITTIPTAAMYTAFRYHKSLQKKAKAYAQKKNADPIFQETAQYILNDK